MDGTTIVAVTRNGKTAIAGDGQITMGQNMVMKGTAVKVRRIHEGRVVVGFAGAVADAMTLSDLFEGKLQQHAGNLRRAAVELAKNWRSDKV
ncbi:MAG: HslU--HslV peptidase proteolytic subunit, partial [Clostridia bacterium]|nr:HslU--HslV peptidase proteolytic subunit [Clostridia bacterium]